MSEALAEKIKEQIAKNRLNVQSLEKEAGLKVNAVRNILLGRSKKPSADTLLAISKALNCSISELLDESLPSQQKNSTIKDEVFSNFDLLLDCISCVIKTYSKYEEEITTKELMGLAYDIYKYSSENNNGQLDQKFSQWVLEKQFD